MMPSMRKKVSSFFRQLSVNSGENADQTDYTKTASGSFIQRYLSGMKVRRQEPTILYGRTPQELPALTLGRIIADEETIFAACTGPCGGLTSVNVGQQHLTTTDPDVDYIDIIDVIDETASTADDGSTGTQRHEEIAGVCNWNRPHNRACGQATTLYEMNPVTKQNAGNPIADCFSIVARENSAILALADGVNWGEKARIAARSAVHGCTEYLNKTLFNPLNNTKVTNTTEVFICLLRSFHVAHSLIIQEKGMLTTLTVAVVLPLISPNKFVACVCNVGDSLAYVYSLNYGVREITKGSHDIHCMRDMRDALGALGPVVGTNPELSNLTCSMSEVDVGDIVFITSDGVSDNFDPVVGKFAVMPSNKPDIATNNLPVVQAIQRHELTLLRLEDLLRNNVSGDGPVCTTAKDLSTRLLDFAVRLTSAKRRILEDIELYCKEDENGELVELSKSEQRSRRKSVCEKLVLVPGKLDHATVVAYNVGRYKPTTTSQSTNNNHKSRKSVYDNLPQKDLFETTL